MNLLSNLIILLVVAPFAFAAPEQHAKQEIQAVGESENDEHEIVEAKNKLIQHFAWKSEDFANPIAWTTNVVSLNEELGRPVILSGFEQLIPFLQFGQSAFLVKNRPDYYCQLDQLQDYNDLIELMHKPFSNQFLQKLATALLRDEKTTGSYVISCINEFDKNTNDYYLRNSTKGGRAKKWREKALSFMLNKMSSILTNKLEQYQPNSIEFREQVLNPLHQSSNELKDAIGKVRKFQKSICTSLINDRMWNVYSVIKKLLENDWPKLYKPAIDKLKEYWKPDHLSPLHIYMLGRICNSVRYE